MEKINLVVFDFDGTLSADDSNFAFGRYLFKKSIRPWLFLPVIGFAGVLSVFNKRGQYWRELMRKFISEDLVKKHSRDFIKIHKMRRFGWSKDQVAKERAIGNVVILISAGPDYLIPSLVSDMKFDAVLTSKMEKGKPWKYQFFCYNTGKVDMLNFWAKENKYLPKIIRSYSDSKADLPIMSLAKEEVWINPKTGMRK